MQGDNLNFFSVAELLRLQLPGYPLTRQGWDALVKRDKWSSREVKGLGGPGGIKNEYQPPPKVMALIESSQRGEPPAAPASKSAHTAKDAALSLYRVHESSDPHGEIDWAVLDACLRACSAVYGEEFDKLASAQQLGYAVDLYNLLVRMCHSQGVAIGSVKRLETIGLSEQLGAFIKMGWAQKFPPPAGYCF